MLADGVVRRQTGMRQHSYGIETRGRENPRMRAVQRRVMLSHGRHPQLLELRLLQALRLGASVLKPDLHLQQQINANLWQCRDESRVSTLETAVRPPAFPARATIR